MLQNSYFNTKDLVNILESYDSTKKFGPISSEVRQMNFWLTAYGKPDINTGVISEMCDTFFGAVLGPIIFRNIEADIVQYGEIFVTSPKDVSFAISALDSLKRYDSSIEGGCECECCGSWVEHKEDKHGDWIKFEDVQAIIDSLKK